MAYENGTPNYDLPQTVPSDKRDWADTNIPFMKLDQDLHYTKELAEGFDLRIATVEDTVDEHAVRLTELEKFIEDSEDGSKHDYQPGNLFLKDGRVMVAITEIHEGHTLVEGQNYEVFEYGDSGLEDRVAALETTVGDVEEWFELDNTSSEHTYSEGQLLLVNGKICIATDDISVGDSLVEGTNYEVFDVAGEGGVVLKFIVIDANSMTVGDVYDYIVNSLAEDDLSPSQILSMEIQDSRSTPVARGIPIVTSDGIRLANTHIAISDILNNKFNLSCYTFYATNNGDAIIGADSVTFSQSGTSAITVGAKVDGDNVDKMTVYMRFKY